MSQPPYLVIKNVETTSYFLKVNPKIMALEGQNNELKQIRCPTFLGGGGVWPIGSDVPTTLFGDQKCKNNYVITIIGS